MPVLLSFSFISWLTEVHLVFSTRRAHQMFQMFISCLCTQRHFECVSLCLQFLSRIYKHCSTIFWYGNLLFGNLRSALFFSFESGLVFLHSSPKNSLSLKFSSLALQYVSVLLFLGHCVSLQFCNQICIF